MVKPKQEKQNGNIINKKHWLRTSLDVKEIHFQK